MKVLTKADGAALATLCENLQEYIALGEALRSPDGTYSFSYEAAVTREHATTVYEKPRPETAARGCSTQIARVV
jgi:hypothetical protein